MKTLRYFAERHPNHVGEILRDEFFVAKLGDWEFKDTVTNVSSKIVPKDSEEGNGHEDYTLSSARLNIDGEEIVCEWYWDENYFLLFEFDDGTCLSNYNAGKDRGWEFNVTKS